MAAIDVRWSSDDDEVTPHAAGLHAKAQPPTRPYVETESEQPSEPVVPSLSVDPTPQDDLPTISEDEPVTDTTPAQEHATEPLNAPQAPSVSPETAPAHPNDDYELKKHSFTPESHQAPQVTHHELGHPELPHEVEAAPLIKAPRHTGVKKALRLTFDLLLVAGIVGLGLCAWSLRSDRDDLSKQLAQVNANPQKVVQQQSDDLVKKVSAITTLPTDEVPTVASVSDATQAQKQSPFFKDALNGDKVLLYAKAGKAILYRPSTNKVILEAPLTFTNSAATAKQ